MAIDTVGTLTEVTVTGVKPPRPSAHYPNPLHKYASYTYSWTLWWLDMSDYNTLAASRDVTDALSYNLSNKSYVIAEDSGLYPDRRHPATFGLSYNIQDVTFTTTVGPSKRSRSSNLIDGSMTIVEPYGVSLIDVLVAASFDGSQFTNWCVHPYMLELNFKGYDDNGEEITPFESKKLMKRFPITILEVKAEVNGSGSTYRIKFANAANGGLTQEYGCIPKPIVVEAGTVKEFFDHWNTKSFTRQLNNHYLSSTIIGKAMFADSYEFDIDPAIANSKIVYDKQQQIQQGNPSARNIDLTKTGFSIPAGSSIIDIITRVLAQSEYIIQAQLKLGTGTDLPQDTIFNSFKTQVRSEFIGVNGDSEEILTNNFDSIRSQYPKKFTYTIHQYSTWSAPHPALPMFADSVPFTCKQYDYTFTGQNVDIVDLKLNFDLTYYVPVLAWPNQVASTLATSSTSALHALTDQLNLTLSPSLFSRVMAGFDVFKTILNPSPMRNQPVVNKPQLTNAMGTLNKPGAQVGMDVLDSLFNRSEGDMVKMNLTIVGDPTLIRQDDWLYVPSPNETSAYNNWDKTGQYEFVDTHQHFRMDVGELPILVNIRSILDVNEDTGLSFPDPSTSGSSALFSGQYTLQKVVNKFSKGVFTQDLVLTRIPNQSYVVAYATGRDGNRDLIAQARLSSTINATSTSQTNQTTTASSNGTAARQ